jgi:Cu(I)/Ag(I) efflux system periplasmic protein CusF
VRIISALVFAIALCLGPMAALAQSDMASGEVVKVDPSAKKITIKHGPIPKLDMDMPMTMVYAAPDPNMLAAVKAGDKIKFEAEQVNGQYTLTKIEKAK